jgi:hypothetical protein
MEVEIRKGSPLLIMPLNNFAVDLAKLGETDAAPEGFHRAVSLCTGTRAANRFDCGSLLKIVQCC